MIIRHSRNPKSVVFVAVQVHPYLFAMLSEVYREYYFPQLSAEKDHVLTISIDKENYGFLHPIGPI